MAGAVVVMFLQFGPSPAGTWIVPAAACAIASLAFALKWPAESWRWGIWLSSGFWIFFLSVFVAYLSVGTFDWLTVLRALSVLAAGIPAAALGEILRRSVSRTA